MNRRAFVVAGLAAAAAPGASKRTIRKGVLISMLPKDLPLEDRLKVARDVGFEDLECRTVNDPNEVEAIKKAADKAGLKIHSVMNMGHWQFPLNSSDPEVVKKGLQFMETSLKNAHDWGAGIVLLVPAVVNPKHSYYEEAWKRSQAQIRKLIPLAEKLKVVIAIEEVWNKFLLSPLEMARYVDEFRSPWVKAYLDVGNMMFYGYPEDWIRVLNKRIAAVHLKDFRYRKGQVEWTPLREGDVDWIEVHKALTEVNFRGTATVELPAGDAAYLREVSRRVDLILEGVKG